MKNLMLIVFVLGISLHAYSQEREYQTLFSFENSRISGMGGPFMQFTTVDGEFAFMMGGGGGVLLNDFFIGGYGLGQTNPVYAASNTDPNLAGYELAISHGGFWIGYSLWADRAIHLSLSSLIGWGVAGFVDPLYNTMIQHDNIFVLAPIAEVELNLTRYFRIGVGATYNLYASLNNLDDYSTSKLSAPGIFLDFKFGWF